MTSLDDSPDADPVGHWTDSAMEFLGGLEGHHGGSSQRYARTRHGPRGPLPWMLRLLILKRDGFRCRFCGQHGGALEVDHVRPWSAGGRDVSTNLRTLCEECNHDRSNLHTIGDDAKLVPATWLCDTCFGPYGDEDVPITAYCGFCDSLSYVSDRSRLQE